MRLVLEPTEFLPTKYAVQRVSIQSQDFSTGRCEMKIAKVGTIEENDDGDEFTVRPEDESGQAGEFFVTDLKTALDVMKLWHQSRECALAVEAVHAENQKLQKRLDEMTCQS